MHDSSGLWSKEKYQPRRESCDEITRGRDKISGEEDNF